MPVNARDVMGFAGLALLAAGLWLAFGLATMLMICGGILLALALGSAIWSSHGHSG